MPKKLDLFSRLLEKVKIDEVTDCWEFQGGKNNIGYGMIRDEKKMRTSHRVSYELHNDIKIPAGMCVCHSCDNPICCNPKHLWLGTRRDNSQDMITKGRANYGAKLGKKHRRLVCEYCNRDVANNTHSRWHGEKCKHKPTE